MSKSGARTALLTSAMVVAGIRLWLQVRGKTKTPLEEWVVGWGATFFVLALLSGAAPTAAGGLSILIAFADFMDNGVTLVTDINSVVTGGVTGNILVDNPLSGSGTTPTSTSGQTTAKSGSTSRTASKAGKTAINFDHLPPLSKDAPN